MPTTRISVQSHYILAELARSTGWSMQDILDAAIETYRRQRFLDEASAAFAALRADSNAWKAELDERRLWETAIPAERKKS